MTVSTAITPEKFPAPRFSVSTSPNSTAVTGSMGSVSVYRCVRKTSRPDDYSGLTVRTIDTSNTITPAKFPAPRFSP
ncbi:MAG: hypothetical protein IJS39_17225 [Synergistaceae bacterium]|nr:hypothetical protein [Synergistaceae bacterium]